MCVILACQDKRPTKSMVDAAWNRNSHGGGIAWRESGAVKWEKNLDLNAMQDMIAKLPMPFVAHFRIASTGSKSAELCHPFEVTQKMPVKLAGKTTGSVLFHNGTWGQWRTQALEFAIKRGVNIPIGEWNDTRTMAWLTSHLGDGFLEFVNEKVILFGPRKLEFFGDGWEDVEGIYASNKLFLPTTHFPANRPQSSVNNQGVGRHVNHSTIIGVIAPHEKVGGPSLDVPFRGGVKIVRGWEDIPEPVEEVAEGQSTPDEQAASENTGEKEEVKMVVCGPKLSPDEVKTITAWGGSGFNPKRFHTSTPIVGASQSASDDLHRQKRIDANRRGISFIGSL